MRLPTPARVPANKLRSSSSTPSVSSARTSRPNAGTSTTWSPPPTLAGCSPARSNALPRSASTNPTAGTRTRRSDPLQLAPLGGTVLQGKRILVTGVLNDASIAFAVARLAQEQGAEVVLSSFGRVMRLTERAAKRLPSPEVAIVELDVTNEDDLAGLAAAVGGTLDGVVHSLAFAPESCLGGGFLDAPWADVSVALQVSAYSLKALAVATLPLLGAGASIVGLDFDNDDAAWP